ncbi:MAG: AbrB/MazE/SpoVT family DNA-binding domain-containing protein [Gammaproteobacteria bacterium]|nr:AbrB/MazE/SpoVT family DNA-binding domain-containing protein [Gammaproteobacteria bacterium]
MAHLIKIGNSQGIRIPKSIIEQSHLDGVELQLRVVEEGLLVIPAQHARYGWKESIDKALATQGEVIEDKEWLDATLTSDEDLEW